MLHMLPHPSRPRCTRGPVACTHTTAHAGSCRHPHYCTRSQLPAPTLLHTQPTACTHTTAHAGSCLHPHYCTCNQLRARTHTTAAHAAGGLHPPRTPATRAGGRRRATSPSPGRGTPGRTCRCTEGKAYLEWGGHNAMQCKPAAQARGVRGAMHGVVHGQRPSTWQAALAPNATQLQCMARRPSAPGGHCSLVPAGVDAGDVLQPEVPGEIGVLQWAGADRTPHSWPQGRACPQPAHTHAAHCARAAWQQHGSTE